MPSGVFLHIGAPKSASTTLQRRVLACHPQVHYVGEGGDGWDNVTAAEVAEKMIFSDDLFFPAAECAQLFAAQRLKAGDRAFIYSNGDIMTSRRPTDCARRLHELLPDAKVIIVLRNQFTALASYWANHGAFLKPAPPGHFRRFVALDDWLEWCLRFPFDTPFANFLYGEIVALYARLWGRERVHLMLFEDFLADPEAFVRRFARLLCIDEEQAAALARGGHERRRNSVRILAWHRFYSRFLWGFELPRILPGRDALLRAWQRFLASGPAARIDIPAHLRARVGKFYASGNARLVSEWNLDLARHGYPLADIQ
jgi:hypothetical protein